MLLPRYHGPFWHLGTTLSWSRFVRCRRFATTASSNGINGDLVDELHRGLSKGRRDALARSITLVETTNVDKRSQANRLMERVETDLRGKPAGWSFRVGLSGPPGAGKSTFVEAFGKSLLSRGHRVAVLAVDPSSGTTGGSLLADKTRMPELSRDPRAFIRPSPSAGHLGGVARTTNESVQLCECAGYDVVLVETVGVGQSEYLVADMVDMFCLIIPPAGGDELQGIKRGIVEQCDLILVNKCDGDLVPAARRIKAEYSSALKYMRGRRSRAGVKWRTPVKLVSALTGDGVTETWDTMEEFRQVMIESGALEAGRSEQRRRWMWSYLNHKLLNMFTSHPAIKGRTELLEREVVEFRLSPGNAADSLIRTFLSEWQLGERRDRNGDHDNNCDKVS